MWPRRLLHVELNDMRWRHRPVTAPRYVLQSGRRPGHPAMRVLLSGGGSPARSDPRSYPVCRHSLTISAAAPGHMVAPGANRFANRMPPKCDTNAMTPNAVAAWSTHKHDYTYQDLG